jgi:hypothetical protein
MTNGQQPVDDRAVVEQMVAAAASGMDFAGWLAGALARAAARLGSTEALLAGRPGSWEAGLVRQILAGTVGEDDEYLAQYRERPTQ